MIRKKIFYSSLVFIIIVNILIDINIRNYINILNECFNQTINLTTILYTSICFIFALISFFIVINMKLIIFYDKEEIKGIKFKPEDGTYGTANWLSNEKLDKILGKNDVPGLILGKKNNDIIKLPFDSFFNKNILVVGSSGSMKTIRFCNYKFT